MTARLPGALTSWAEAARIRSLNAHDVRPTGRYVLCWLQQALRGVDNPVIDAAIRLGNALDRPVLIYGSPQQQRAWLRRTTDENGWWGNALNPRDTRLQALPLAHKAAAQGYELNGTKGFCSGTRGSHYLTVSARVEGQSQPVLGLLETAAAGIAVKDDWHSQATQES